MKRNMCIVIVLGLLFASQATFAEPIVTGLWQVNSLFDDSGAKIFSLEMDIEIGRVYLAAHGSIELEGSGWVPVSGSGYFSENGLVFYLNVGQHLMTIFMDNHFDGSVYIYGPDNKPIDEGTLTYKKLEM
jgi:hypothetical protein